ncbi:MAG: PadR family transcriptional regulator [bacterium]
MPDERDEQRDNERMEEIGPAGVRRGDGTGRRRGAGRGTGRGRGRRGGRGRRRIMRFLRPCVLVLLAKEPGHGYRLLGELEPFGIDPDSLDPSLLYRLLREMEQEDLLESEWDTESQGPRRRVYRLTAAGREALEVWMEDLERSRQEIARLLEAYRRLVKE